MSLGGGASTALDNAVSNSIAAGVTYAVARPATANCRTPATRRPRASPRPSPSAPPTATDARASFSNYGTCVDIFAPGVDITSAWYTSNTATNTISGTSMATPHVAGVAALYLQGNPTASPATVRNAIVAERDAEQGHRPGSGSPNRLLYTNY